MLRLSSARRALLSAPIAQRRPPVSISNFAFPRRVAQVASRLGTWWLNSTSPKEGAPAGKSGQLKSDEEKEQVDGKGQKKDDDETPWYKDKILWSALAGLGVLVLIQRWTTDSTPSITFQEFKRNYLQAQTAEKLEVINKTKVNVYSKASPRRHEAHFEIGSPDVFERQLEETQTLLGMTPEQFVKVYYHQGFDGSTLFSFAPLVLILGFWIFLAQRSVKRMPSSGLMGMGKARVQIGHEVGVKTTFKDIAGMDEAKQEIMEFVQFLKAPEKFTKLGAKIPKGAILVGPPGTGKTMLAKATAGEAGTPFFSISGSDFIEMFVGVGPSRVRDLFKRARESTPAIIFIDEIDAIGRSRSSRGFASGQSDERENTLNQLLVEMDGFSSTGGVVVLASTNRPDILDPALMRPGRFDRQIEVDKPDAKGREAIFKVHMERIKLRQEPGRDLAFFAKELAKMTPGFVGADIANVCNEAALIAARNDQSEVLFGNFEAAIDRVVGGLEKKTRVMTPEEKKTVAFHEAGHAIMGWFLEHADPLLKVSIIPRGSAALGFAQYLPKERFLYSEGQLFDRMCMMLGGRVAELITFGRISTGAQDDLDKITRLAYAQVTTFGMNSNVGQVSFPQPREGDPQFDKPYSQETSERIDTEVRALVKRAFDRTYQMLTERKDSLSAVAQLLLEKEIIRADDLKTLLGDRPWGAPEPSTQPPS